MTCTAARAGRRARSAAHATSLWVDSWPARVGLAPDGGDPDAMSCRRASMTFIDSIRLVMWPSCRAAGRPRSSLRGRTSPLDEPHHHRDDGEHDEDVNEPTERVRRHETERPEGHQDDSDSPEHGCLLWV